MPRCPSNFQKVYSASTLEIILCQCRNWLWFKVQDRIIWRWCDFFSKCCTGTKRSKRIGCVFSAKIAMNFTKGAVLRLQKIIINMLWGSCMSRISWLYVSSLHWISIPLSTLLTLIVPTRLLVTLIWRTMPGLRSNAKIASRTANRKKRVYGYYSTPVWSWSYNILQGWLPVSNLTKMIAF